MKFEQMNHNQRIIMICKLSEKAAEKKQRTQIKEKVLNKVFKKT